MGGWMFLFWTQIGKSKYVLLLQGTNKACNIWFFQEVYLNMMMGKSVVSFNNLVLSLIYGLVLF